MSFSELLFELFFRPFKKLHMQLEEELAIIMRHQSTFNYINFHENLKILSTLKLPNNQF